METVSCTFSLRKPKNKASYTFETFRREAMKVAKSCGACHGVCDAIHEATEPGHITFLLSWHRKFMIDNDIHLHYSQECADYLAEHGWRSQELLIDNKPITRFYQIV